MNRTLIKIPLFFLLPGLISLSCNRNSYEGDIIAVELAGELTDDFTGAEIIVFDPDHPNKKARTLSDNFESACSPALSYDARILFFQGKKEEDKKWQIWKMDLQTKKFKQILDLPENCTHPLPLPDGSIIFSRDLSANGRKYSALYKCQEDGSMLSRITFNQGQNIFANILAEGRVIYSSSRQYPSSSAPNVMIMRPDGTKSEIYFRGTSANHPRTKGLESSDGYIYFINNKEEIVRVNHQRPLFSIEKIDPASGGNYLSVAPLNGNECLVSWHARSGDPYAIYKVDLLEGNVPELVREGDKHIMNPILVKPLIERPMILPSPVDPGKPTGIIMSQDINHSMLPAKPGLNGDAVATQLRVSGTDGELGVIEVKEDGSVYLEMDADTPFRFETLNSMGETVRGPSDWIYLRPNERRACVGCHADPELAPKNFQPLAVKEGPVVLSEKKKE